jgi:hypothetical protein
LYDIICHQRAKSHVPHRIDECFSGGTKTRVHVGILNMPVFFNGSCSQRKVFRCVVSAISYNGTIYLSMHLRGTSFSTSPSSYTTSKVLSTGCALVIVANSHSEDGENKEGNDSKRKSGSKEPDRGRVDKKG